MGRNITLRRGIKRSWIPIVDSFVSYGYHFLHRFPTFGGLRKGAIVPSGLRYDNRSPPFVNSINTADFTTNFIDTQPSDKNSSEHLAIRFSQSCALYMVL